MLPAGDCGPNGWFDRRELSKLLSSTVCVASNSVIFGLESSSPPQKEK